MPALRELCLLGPLTQQAMQHSKHDVIISEELADDNIRREHRSHSATGGDKLRPYEITC